MRDPRKQKVIRIASKFNSKKLTIIQAIHDLIQGSSDSSRNNSSFLVDKVINNSLTAPDIPTGEGLLDDLLSLSVSGSQPAPDLVSPFASPLGALPGQSPFSTSSAPSYGGGGDVFGKIESSASPYARAGPSFLDSPAPAPAFFASPQHPISSKHVVVDSATGGGMVIQGEFNRRDGQTFFDVSITNEVLEVSVVKIF